jgi:hypothetical protein
LGNRDYNNCDTFNTNSVESDKDFLNKSSYYQGIWRADISCIIGDILPWNPLHSNEVIPLYKNLRLTAD